MHAKKLKSEIAGLEASLVGRPQRYQGYNNIGNSGKIRMANTSLLVSKKIIQVHPPYTLMQTYLLFSYHLKFETP